MQTITQVGVGAASDRFGRDVATAGRMLLAAAGFGLLIAVPGRVAVAAAIVLLGTGLGWDAALLPRFIDVLSAVERSVGFGLVRTVYEVVVALGSAGTGLVADLAGWGTAFALLAGLLSLVLAALVANWVGSLGY